MHREIEKTVLSQINDYIETYLSDLFTSFQKSHSLQKLLPKVTQTNNFFFLDNWYHIVTLFINLSKNVRP